MTRCLLLWCQRRRLIMHLHMKLWLVPFQAVLILPMVRRCQVAPRELVQPRHPIVSTSCISHFLARGCMLCKPVTKRQMSEVGVQTSRKVAARNACPFDGIEGCRYANCQPTPGCSGATGVHVVYQGAMRITLTPLCTWVPVTGKRIRPHRQSHLHSCSHWPHGVDENALDTDIIVQAALSTLTPVCVRLLIGQCSDLCADVMIMINCIRIPPYACTWPLLLRLHMHPRPPLDLAIALAIELLLVNGNIAHDAEIEVTLSTARSCGVCVTGSC